MQGVRATLRGSVSCFRMFSLLILAATPASVFAGDGPDPADPSSAKSPGRVDVWGERTPGDPFRVVWVLPKVAGTEEAWLWIGDRRMQDPGERLVLPGVEHAVRVWTVPRTALSSKGSGDSPGWRIGLGTNPDVPPTARTPLTVDEILASGPEASVICIDCEGIATVEIDRALAARTSEHRDRLHPEATPILQLSGSRIYPNPFNPLLEDADIEFTLSEAAEVEITAYDWNGDYVDTVFRGSGTAGTQTVRWAGQTEDGRKLGNGVYLIRVVAKVDSRQESQVVKAVVWNEN